MNTKLQGNIGIGKAIAHFTELGYIVSIPLTDSQKYDLIVDIDSLLYRVQVKTTTFKVGNVYQVLLKTNGGNKTRTTESLFDNSESDILFIWCDDGSMFSIPTLEISNTHTLNLGDKVVKYKLSQTISHSSIG